MKTFPQMYMQCKVIVIVDDIDDTDVVWPHGTNTLNQFLEHLNNQNDNIKFTMEIEENNRLPFLDVLISRNEDGSF